MDDIPLQFILPVPDDHTFFLQIRKIRKHDISGTCRWKDQLPAQRKCFFIFPSPDLQIIDLRCDILFLAETLFAALPALLA